MKKIFFILFFSGLHFSLFSQSFEGKIYFQKKSIADTVYFTYHIKDDLIRIDEYNRFNKLNKSVIFNISEKTIVALNPQKKLYTNIPAPKSRNSNDNSLITKSNNYRIINGYKCYQWRVKNVSKNTEVAYWVAQHEFKYFDELLRMWHNQDSNLDFFLELPENDGYMPMLSVERTLLRDEKLRFAVVDIQKINIDDGIFKIPNDYTAIDYNYR